MTEQMKSVTIGYGAYMTLCQWWWGQGDPLYAVLSRRGNSVDFVTLEASEQEIDRLEETVEEVLGDPQSTNGEKRAVSSFLRALKEG